MERPVRSPIEIHPIRLNDLQEGMLKNLRGKIERASSRANILRRRPETVLEHAHQLAVKGWEQEVISHVDTETPGQLAGLQADIYRRGVNSLLESIPEQIITQHHREAFEFMGYLGNDRSFEERTA